MFEFMQNLVSSGSIPQNSNRNRRYPFALDFKQFSNWVSGMKNQRDERSHSYRHAHITHMIRISSADFEMPLGMLTSSSCQKDQSHPNRTPAQIHKGPPQRPRCMCQFICNPSIHLQPFSLLSLVPFHMNIPHTTSHCLVIVHHSRTGIVHHYQLNPTT